MTDGQILALRFVLRDGQRILQQATSARMDDGTVVYGWEDVPCNEEEGS
jgi:hypothetical protein